MKKAIAILFLLSFHCSGQEGKNFFIDATEMIIRNNDGYYNVNGLAIGKKFPLNDESLLDLSITYRLLGNLGGLNTSSYKFNSHLLGGCLAYNFWPKEKWIRPFVGLAFYTEIATNYKNGLLRGQGHKPTDRYSKSGDRRSARWYKGTPIVGNFFFGLNIKLIPSLYLKTAFGVGYERVKSKSLSWIEGEVANPLEEAENQPMMLSPIFSWNLQVGLRYVLPFKKKEKPQPK